MRTSPISIASIPVSAALSLNNFKQGGLHGSQASLTYMQENISVKTWMERSFFFSSIKTCKRCMCVHMYIFVNLHPLAFVHKCEFVCLCLQRSCIQKSSIRCHTQTYKCRFNRNNSDLPRLSASESTCHHASSSHPTTPSLNSYFTLICVFFTTAKSFIRGYSSSNLNI